MFEVLRRNADVIAMMGADLFSAAVSELVEDMGEWVDQGELPPEVKDWLPYIARNIAGGAFQVAAQLADAKEPDIDAAARFCSASC